MDMQDFLQTLLGITPAAAAPLKPPPASFNDRFNAHRSGTGHDGGVLEGMLRQEPPMPPALPPPAMPFNPSDPPMAAQPPMAAPMGAPMQSPMMASPMSDVGASRRAGPESAPGGGLLSAFLPEGTDTRRITAALAGGFSGGNPDFGLGALMKGAGGAMSGASKSDETDFDQQLKLLSQALKAQEAGDNASYKEAMTAYYKALAQNGGSRRGAWNKPPEERARDGEVAIERINKRLDLKQRAVADDYRLSPEQRQEKLDAIEQERAQAATRINKRFRLDADGNPPEAGGEISMQGQGTPTAPYQPSTAQDYEEIPPGAHYIHPSDGKVRRKGSGPN